MEKVRPWCGQPSDRGRLKIRSDQYTNTISGNLAILLEKHDQEKPCVLRRMFCKLDVRPKKIVTLALS